MPKREMYAYGAREKKCETLQRPGRKHMRGGHGNKSSGKHYVSMIRVYDLAKAAQCSRILKNPSTSLHPKPNAGEYAGYILPKPTDHTIRHRPYSTFPRLGSEASMYAWLCRTVTSRKGTVGPVADCVIRRFGEYIPCVFASVWFWVKACARSDGFTIKTSSMWIHRYMNIITDYPNFVCNAAVLYVKMVDKCRYPEHKVPSRMKRTCMEAEHLFGQASPQYVLF
jgi:hypothetical protein